MAWLVLCLLTFGAGCAGTSAGGAVMRSAVDVPPRFEPRDRSERLAPADTIAGSGCLSPMVDPRDGAELHFVRSAEGHADYVVPDGRYGVQAGELLRLECNTGRVLGIVRR